MNASPDPLKPLKNQKALVTGASSGIGEACALALGAAGADVVVNYRSNPDEADRVVAIQHRMQAIAPAMLHAKKIGRGGYVLRELQPSSDRLTLDDARGDHRHLRSAAKSMGRVTAWAQLRSSGRQGSATADDLIAFAGANGWKQRLIDFGRSYESQVKRDYQQFLGAQKERE